MGKRQRFTKEFKLEAVRLMQQSDRPGVEIARELGVRRNQLYKWAAELDVQGEGAFPGPGRQAPPAAELARLKRELTRVTEERDIFKKAAAYFAKELS